MNCFSFPSARLPATGAALGFTVQERPPDKPFPMFFPANHSRCFFLPITLAPARKNLQEIHFKTEGTGAAAYLRTEENLWR